MAVDTRGHYGRKADFMPMTLENPETTGIQQAPKENRIVFTSFPSRGRADTSARKGGTSKEAARRTTIRARKGTRRRSDEDDPGVTGIDR